MSDNQNLEVDGSENLDDFFGTAKSGSDMNWKMHALKDDGSANIFRIAPPVKSLKNVGKWKIYDKLHYGYTVPNDQNADKPRHKPFRCIEKKNRATNMIEQDCPECALLKAKEDEITAVVNQYIAQGKSPAEAEEYVKGARKILREHNLDKKWYLLAKNLAGEWGTLKLGHRAMTALDDARTKYMKENGGVDPLDARSGVWFEFTRQGKGLETRYTATIAMESLGRGQFQVKSGALTAVDAEALKKCPDLAKLNDNKSLSYDQILALVRSGGEPSVVAAVFNTTRRTEQAPASTPEPTRTGASAGTGYAAAPTPVQPPAPVAQAAPAATTPAQDARAALLAQLAALDAAAAQPTTQKVAAAVETITGHKVVSVTTAAPAASKPAAAEAPVGDLMKLDAADFLKLFPDPNKK
jgi:hypothetical protein